MNTRVLKPDSEARREAAQLIREGRLVASGETKALTDGRSLEELFLEVVEHAPAD